MNRDKSLAQRETMQHLNVAAISAMQKVYEQGVKERAFRQRSIRQIFMCRSQSAFLTSRIGTPSH